MNCMSFNRAQKASFLGLFSLVVALTAISIFRSSNAADETLSPDLSLSAFMRKKLNASSQILEGLTIEDAELIQKGAKSLLELSKAEKWQILISPDYREYSLEFRNDVRKLEEAAIKGNFDNAALQWFGVTRDCIECHRYLRQEQKPQK